MGNAVQNDCKSGVTRDVRLGLKTICNKHQPGRKKTLNERGQLGGK